jgi:hypothetical protein
MRLVGCGLIYERRVYHFSGLARGEFRGGDGHVDCYKVGT